MGDEVSRWFQAVDLDRSGRINASELQNALIHGKLEVSLTFAGMYREDRVELFRFSRSGENETACTPPWFRYPPVQLLKIYNFTIYMVVLRFLAEEKENGMRCENAFLHLSP